MIQVSGVLDDVPYQVVLTGRADDPVQGSRRVRALVDAAVRQGRHVLATPTGPRTKVTGADTDSLLRLLAASGRVVTVVGNTPALSPSRPGVVS